MVTRKTPNKSKLKQSIESVQVPTATAKAGVTWLERIKKYLDAGNVSAVVFVLFAYVMLAMRNGYVLRWYDELSLFEPTSLFFRQFLYYPGGLFRYAGTWLTQFMYYPVAGSIILISLWVGLIWITCKAFDLAKDTVAFSIAIPLAMLASIVQIDESWLTLKTPGYIYSNTLGYIYAILLIWLFRKSNHRTVISLILPSLMAMTYPIAGFFGLLAAAICLIFQIAEGIRMKDYKSFISVAVAVALILVVPRLYYTYLQGNLVDNDFLMLKGLPEFLLESFDIYLWVPFIVATAWIMILGILKATNSLHVNRLSLWIGIAAICAGMAWNVSVDHKSERFRVYVLMMRYIDQHNWPAINNIMNRMRERPTYSMLVINNLANACQGHETPKLPKFQPEHVDGRHNENFTISVFVKVPVNYYIGENNESYRWCMEHNVQYGKRVFFLKYMVKNALINGEIKLAKRYNDLLMSTMFHRKWAEEMNRYIADPSLIGTNEEFQAVRSFIAGK